MYYVVANITILLCTLIKVVYKSYLYRHLVARGSSYVFLGGLVHLTPSGLFLGVLVPLFGVFGSTPLPPTPQPGPLLLLFIALQVEMEAEVEFWDVVQDSQ